MAHYKRNNLTLVTWEGQTKINMEFQLNFLIKNVSLAPSITHFFQLQTTTFTFSLDSVQLKFIPGVQSSSTLKKKNFLNFSW
jgi:hypothetical protein